MPELAKKLDPLFQTILKYRDQLEMDEAQERRQAKPTDDSFAAFAEMARRYQEKAAKRKAAAARRKAAKEAEAAKQAEAKAKDEDPLP